MQREQDYEELKRELEALVESGQAADAQVEMLEREIRHASRVNNYANVEPLRQKQEELVALEL